MHGRERHLVWDGCLNVRDLGGHPTEDGGSTRYGTVIRADCVRQLTDRGWQEVVSYGVRTVVDLRLHDELEADPPGDLPVDVVHVPVFDGIDGDYWQWINSLSLEAKDPASALQNVYLDFLTRFQRGFASAVAAVGRAADDGAVVVHCAVGKDRTGLVSALLLRLAGVSADHIAADYALSERNLAPLTESWVAEAADERERLLRRRLAASPREAILGVLERIERAYGDARRYLLAGGAGEQELERARDRLRG